MRTVEILVATAGAGPVLWRAVRAATGGEAREQRLRERQRLRWMLIFRLFRHDVETAKGLVAAAVQLPIDSAPLRDLSPSDPAERSPAVAS